MKHLAPVAALLLSLGLTPVNPGLTAGNDAAGGQIPSPSLTPQLGEGTPTRTRGHVSFAAEPQTLPAGRLAPLDLSFTVDPGFHVNSHTPHSELLIPTTLTLDPVPGVTPGQLSYPLGTTFSFASNPTEKLDVYTGSFHLRLPVKTTPGEHTLTATLHYQACDHAACYPPRSLPVQILFTAR